MVAFALWEFAVLLLLFVLFRDFFDLGIVNAIRARHAESYRRRGERVRFGMSVDEVVELAGKVFSAWPWGNGYEELGEAVGLFDAGY